MKHFVYSLCCLLCSSVVLSQTPMVSDSLTLRRVSPTNMQEDFSFLRKVLEETHPGLYRYTSKAAMQQKMDSIAGQLQHEMSFYSYYRVLTSLIAAIRCAHTSITPTNNIGKYFRETIHMLPLEIIPFRDRLLVTLNGTTDTTIRPGDELLTINGQTTAQVLQELYSYVWADGYVQSSKTSQIMGTKFCLFYYMMIAQPDTFNLSLRRPDGTAFSMKVPALPNKTFHPQFFKNPVNRALLALYKDRNEKDNKEGWRLETMNIPQTAYLRIKGFGGGKNEEGAAAKMRSFMDKNMKTLQKGKIEHLIVDLRNNGGGWDIQGLELFSYLTKDTSSWYYYRRQYTITDSSEFLRYGDLSPEELRDVRKELLLQPDGTFNLQAAYNKSLTIQKAKPNHFKGKLYFLFNGGTGSSAAEFAALVRSHNTGVIIGEEVGAAYEGGNSGSFLHFQLPHTGISVGTPLVAYEMAVDPPAQKGRGAFPDHAVSITIAALLQGKDAVLDYTKELIRKEIGR